MARVQQFDLRCATLEKTRWLRQSGVKARMGGLVDQRAGWVDLHGWG